MSVLRRPGARAARSTAVTVDQAIPAAGGPELYRDEELGGYVAIVRQRLGVPAEPDETWFVDEGEPLIAALPPAGVLVGLGLLAQLEDEAQLAFALAREEALHESGVVARRYAEARARGDSGGRLGRTKRVAASLRQALEESWRRGYGQRWEEHADARGFEAILAAGYDPCAAARALNLLAEASPSGRCERFLGASGRAEAVTLPETASVPRGRLNREVYRRAVGGFRVFMRAD